MAFRSITGTPYDCSLLPSLSRGQAFTPYATDLSHALALADFANGAVCRDSAARPKYNRYERWIPYITGNTTKAACQPK